MPVTSKLCSWVKLCGEEGQNIFTGVDERDSVSQKDAPQEFGVDLGRLNVNPPPVITPMTSRSSFPKTGILKFLVFTRLLCVTHTKKKVETPRALAATM